MQIKNRGIEITDVPGVVSAVVSEKNYGTEISLTMEGEETNGPNEVQCLISFDAQGFAEFKAMIDHIASIVDRIAFGNAQREQQEQGEQSGEQPRSPLFGADWFDGRHVLYSECTWPFTQCVGHLTLVPLPTPTASDCRCPSTDCEHSVAETQQFPAPTIDATPLFGVDWFNGPHINYSECAWPTKQCIGHVTTRPSEREQ